MLEFSCVYEILLEHEFCFHLVGWTLGLPTRELLLQEWIVEENTHVVWLIEDKENRSILKVTSHTYAIRHA